jgi:hypothetical protein
MRELEENHPAETDERREDGRNGGITGIVEA